MEWTKVSKKVKAKIKTDGDYKDLNELMNDIENGKFYDIFGYDGKEFTMESYDGAGKEIYWYSPGNDLILLTTPNRYEKNQNGLIEVEELYYRLEDGDVVEEVKGEYEEDLGEDESFYDDEE